MNRYPTVNKSLTCSWFHAILHHVDFIFIFNRLVRGIECLIPTLTIAQVRQVSFNLPIDLHPLHMLLVCLLV